jgi:hypothetical protein
LLAVAGCAKGEVTGSESHFIKCGVDEDCPEGTCDEVRAVCVATDAGAMPAEITTPAPPTGPTPTPPPGSAFESRAAWLTKAQLKYTVLDVLGVSVDDAILSQIPYISPYRGYGIVEGEQALGLGRFAKSVVAQVDPTASATALAQCADTSASCATKLVSRLGLKLFRRPLLAEESARLQTLFATLTAVEGATFDQVYRGLLSAMLQSPQFLYKLEFETQGTPGEARATTGFELASRLSYFLWQSAPDDALLNFAAEVDDSAGKLNAAKLRLQIERMMSDAARFNRVRGTFWADYTGASFAAFDGATPELAAELRQSVVASFSRLAGEGAPEAPLQEMFTTTKMRLTPKVAELIGLPSAGEGLQEYDTQALPQRVGLLTHPGFLAAMGSTDFVRRSMHLSLAVLCREVTPPPESNVPERIDALGNTGSLTPKEASEYRFAAGPTCIVCHKTFEPIAYAFEQFDVMGVHRAKDDMAQDLFTSGYLQDSGGSSLGEYAGVPDLMNLLSTSEETSKCFVRRMLEFASGRRPERADRADRAAVDAAHAEFIREGGAFSHLVRSIAFAPTMQALKVSNPTP